MSIQIRYLGHSAFQLTLENGNVVLIDPWITGNPHIDLDVKTLSAQTILITHGHAHHIGDTVEIARQSGATVVGITEVVNYFNRIAPDIQTEALNIGGEMTFPWGNVVMVPAAHSSTLPDNTPGGLAAGYILKTAGHQIYHAGDTGMSSELRFIGDYYKPNVALLPVGGRYTLGIQDLARAIMWLGCDIMIPMHYNSFDEIQVDLDAVFYEVDHNTSAICKAIAPGETWEMAAAASSGRRSGPESRY